MSIPQFEVVLKGVIAGFDAQQAQHDFAALFSLTHEKVARLFSARRTVLKAGLDEATANKYVARLARIGVEASAEAIDSAPQDAAPVTQAPSMEPVVEPVVEQAPVASMVAQETWLQESVPQEPDADTHQFTQHDENSLVDDAAVNQVSPEADANEYSWQQTDSLSEANTSLEEDDAVDLNAAQENDATNNHSHQAEAVSDELHLQAEQNETSVEDELDIPAETLESLSVNARQKTPPSSVRYEVEFAGAGFEYFKIWIVNLLLSILTLGIYSAWAKVRNKQYFYGNTQIAGTSFEYTAEPLKILKGRVIAIILYAGMIFSGHISPIAQLVFSLAFLAFLPWIIVSSLRFNARHTSYRNIPFRFHGTVWGAVGAFLGWALLGIFSFGLLLPFTWKKQMQYVTNNHSYGNEPFHFDVHVKEYYKVLLIIMGAAMAFGAVMLMMLGGAAALAVLNKDQPVNPANFMALIPVFIAYIVFYFGLGAYLAVSMVNIHMNNTRLKTHQFASNWTLLSYLGLLLTNTLGILITLGLFIPFAKVRTAAYRANHTALIVEGDLDGFIANELEQSNSLGEGVHDIFDIDISL